MTITDNPLAALRDVDETALQRLRGALAEKAAEAQLLDLAYRTVDSPVGPLLLVATERGLTRVAFASQGHDDVLNRLADTVSPRVLEAPRRLDPAARELDEYFTGTRHTFDLTLDLSTTSEFRRAVQLLLPSIGYGHTVSYSELAALAGRPTAVRAVATACATNPLPVVVPCHRVLRGDGSLGGYLGGLDAKRTLLELESRVAA
ncbi:MAG TPA: methylated-DNA--[protein]-cysteine S-methyltransferase [Microlunatus sp.]|nr:methylated-DNA--[protein]-cysteine S-methyltransferase [Microlunatus sp.]